MFIAKIENGKVVKVVDYREVFGTTPPTDEQLVQKSYKRVNLWRDHDRLTQLLVPCDPVIEGDWVYTMKVKNMTADEIEQDKESAMAQIRGTRNQLLALSDYTQIPDNPNPKKSDWAEYRQILRDLPANIDTDPRTFNDWPKDPDWKPMMGENDGN